MSPAARKFVVPLALAAACLLGWAPALRAEYFTTERWHADIAVRRDASFTVRESIEVAFTSQRHGIYRDIPFRYTDDLGHRLKTPLAILSVTDDGGREHPYKVSREGDAVRIRIGDPKRFVEGRQVYVITYRVENAILFLGDHDELYWNVIGTAWPTPVAEASAAVTVEGAGSTGLKTRCFTGVFGSTEASCEASPLEHGAVFKVTRPLNPGEAFTIVLGWDKGVVRAPPASKRFLWAADVAENWVVLLPLLSLVLMFNRWLKRGRDPDVGDTVAVQYTPPEEKGRGLLPAEVGNLADGTLDQRDITATIVDLAVKKHLTIEERVEDGLLFDKKDYLLRKAPSGAVGLGEFEERLLSDLFSGGDEVRISDLKNTFYVKIPGLQEAAIKNLKELGYYADDPRTVKMKYAALGLVIIVGGGFLAGFLGNLLPSQNLPKLVAAVVLSGLCVLCFAPIMPARTRKGALAHLRVRGFEEFLSRAEKDRLERMADKNLFEKYLPYAIALNVSERWAKAFEGVYQEPPRWYISPGGFQAFHPASFNQSLGSAISSMGTAMYSAPRSSGGSGGGGSSGGGFGGGGGGSW